MVTLVYGEERYLVHQAIEQAKASCSSLGCLTTNEFSTSVCALAYTTDLFVDHRVIIYTPEELTTDKVLQGYLAAPCPTTSLVIAPGKLTKTSAIFKELASRHTVTEYTKLSESALERWIVSYLAAAGCRITKDGYLELVRRINYKQTGHDLFHVKHCLELLVHEKDITKELVCQMIEESEEARIFSLGTLLMQKQFRQLFHQVSLLEHTVGFSSIKTLTILCGSLEKQYLASQNPIYAALLKTVTTGIRQIKEGCYDDKEGLRVTMSLCIGVFA